MSGASSASVYGSRPLDDTYVTGRRAPRAHGLRSESAPDGWYAAPRTPRKHRNGPVSSNKPDPAIVRERAVQERAEAFDDMPMIKYGSALNMGLPSIGKAMSND